MKQFLILLAGVAVMAGCGHPGTTVVTGPNGEKINVDENGKGGITTTDGKGNNLSMGGDAISEADLGLAYYPGSTQVEGGNMKADTTEGSSFMNTRTTADEVQKVMDYYKDAIAKAGFTVQGTFVSGDTGSVSGQKGSTSDDVVSVMATRDKEKNLTSVVVTHVIKKAGASPSAPASPS